MFLSQVLQKSEKQLFVLRQYSAYFSSHQRVMHRKHSETNLINYVYNVHNY